MAEQKVYPKMTRILGPFTKYSDALTCAQDTLYPNMGKVIEVDLRKLQSSYIPTSVYPEWQREESATYYHFSDGSTVIPEHWNNSISVEVIRRSEFPESEVSKDVTKHDEKSLVAVMAFMISGEYEEVLVLRDKTPGAVQFFLLSGQLRNVFTMKGWPHRADLIRYAMLANKYYFLAAEGGESAREKFFDAIAGFWEQFVDANTDLPDDWDRDMYHF